MLLCVVAMVGLFIAAYLTLYHYGFIGALSCGTGSCERVQTSRWSMFLGLPVAAWGLAFYALLLVLAFLAMQPRWIESRGLALTLMLLTGWGVLFSAWLTWLEGRVIHAWCEWCLSSAILVTIAFLLSLAEWRSLRALPLSGGVAEA
jgi:uncharacterized membrane protein